MSKNKLELRRIPIEHLSPGRHQPRQHFDQEKLSELALSIQSMGGVLQPIIVRAMDRSNESNVEGYSYQSYEIIAGERRWRAAQMAGLKEIDCLIRLFNEAQALEAGLIENITRDDLNPIEEARAYQRMVEEFNYTHDDVAACVGKQRTSITNSIRLLKLDASMQDYLVDQTLSAGHGKVLAGLPLSLQKTLGHQCCQYGWSVRALEKKVKQHLKASETLKSAALENGDDPNVRDLEAKISAHIGCKVKILFKQNKGRLCIDFHNLDVLTGLLEKIGVE